MDELQTQRMDALRAVMDYYHVPTEDMPDAATLIALAEWVMDGTASLADADERRRAELYRASPTPYVPAE